MYTYNMTENKEINRIYLHLLLFSPPVITADFR